MGRPKKKPEEVVSTKSIQLALADQEFLKEYAAKEKMSFAEAVRFCVTLLKKSERRRKRYEATTKKSEEIVQNV